MQLNTSIRSLKSVKRCFFLSLLLALGSIFLIASPKPAESHGLFYFDSHAPVKFGSAVVSGGHLSMTYAHAGASIVVKGQTKVCGFWGCNYQTKASKTKNIDFCCRSTGEVYVSQPCRSGRNRYRTLVTVTIAEPFYREYEYKYSSAPEFVC